MNKPMILLVEDDKAIANLIGTALDLYGYKVRLAENGAAGILEAVSNSPDIMILDLGLPDMEGLEIIKKVRSWSSMPIIVVSARDNDRDKIEALDLGADDYLTKPFNVEELLARVRVMLRRMASLQVAETAIFQNGELKIDYGAGCVYLAEHEIHLTPIEYRLLCLLSKNVDKVLTYNYILKEIWTNSSLDDRPSLRVFMATLRKKLEDNGDDPKYIQTHIGVGYRMIRFVSE